PAEKRMIDKEFSLTGEVALVTGSGRGLGDGIGGRLGGLGADVAIHVRDDSCCAEFGEFANLDASAADVAKHGTKAVAVTGDIADAGRVVDMAREVESKRGPSNDLLQDP